jgi:hypothetical protein
MMNDRKGTYQAMWFLKKELKEEKTELLEDMRELSLNYWGGADPIIDELIKDVSDRIEEINQILLNVDTGFYKLEE